MQMTVAHRIAAVVVAGGRKVASHLPRSILRAIDNRIFGAIFQVTRVTNAAYGWPAPPPGGGGETGGTEDEPDRSPQG